MCGQQKQIVNAKPKLTSPEYIHIVSQPGPTYASPPLLAVLCWVQFDTA